MNFSREYCNYSLVSTTMTTTATPTQLPPTPPAVASINGTDINAAEQRGAPTTPPSAVVRSLAPTTTVDSGMDNNSTLSTMIIVPTAGVNRNLVAAKGTNDEGGSRELFNASLPGSKPEGTSPGSHIAEGRFY